MTSGLKDKVLALAKGMANEKGGEQWAVFNLLARARDVGIDGQDFTTALRILSDEGLITVTPNCGPRMQGFYKLSGL